MAYFYAVSELLEKATETIFILDWWLSPELVILYSLSQSDETLTGLSKYLRRPPADNEPVRSRTPFVVPEGA
jgi:hypothetical protein